MSGKPQRRGKGKETQSQDGRGGGSGGPAVEQRAVPSSSAARHEVIKEVENKKHEELKAKSGFKEFVLPARPDYSDRGENVLLKANYFELKVKADVPLYRYNVTVALSNGTSAPAGKLLGRLMQLLIEHLGNAQNDVVTDARSMLISRRALDVGNPITIAYRAEGETIADPNARTYDYTLQATGHLSMSDILDHITSTNASGFLGDQEEMVQALNLVVGQYPKTQTAVRSAGKNRYVSITPNVQDCISLGAGLEALRAFVFSVRTATARMLVNVQIKNLAFYNQGSLAQVARQFLVANGNNYRMLHGFLKRVSVETRYIRRPGTNEFIRKYKTIVGLATTNDGRGLPHPPMFKDPRKGNGANSQDLKFWQQTGPDESESAFGLRSQGKRPAASSSTAGRYVTVFDFFQQQHGRADTSPDLPVVNVGTVDNPVYLPMSVCEVRRGQPASVKISPAQTQHMINFAVRRPDQNMTSITTSGSSLLGLKGNNPYLTGFEMSVDSNMITVPGRAMNPPEINYGGNKKLRPGQGAWDLKGTKFHSASAVASLGWVYIHVDGDQPFNKSFVVNQVAGFVAEMKNTGMRAPAAKELAMFRIQQGDPQGIIEPQLTKIASAIPKPDLILFIVSNKDSTFIYNKVKFLCDVKLGLLNICVLDTKLQKANPQYWANVCLKANLKLRGVNHVVPSAELGMAISPTDTMFVGIDVTHPSPGSSSNAPSIAGIVSSIDGLLAQWPADIRIQEARKEMVEPLEEMMLGCLKRWQAKNRTLPRNIIVYRDGVSEGQYKTVIDVELPALRKTIAAIYPATDVKAGQPKISIVIVGKRHHTRFYVANPSDADKYGNPKCGTVVDRGVTNAANWDFFLQAHTAIKGTARPAHYYVIYDQIFRNRKPQPELPNAAGSLEQLSHALCYLFGRATKAVSVCPPAYYADLVCERARCYLSHLFSPTPTPAGSGLSPPVAGGAAGPAGAAVPNLNDAQNVVLHANVRDRMFYI